MNRLGVSIGILSAMAAGCAVSVMATSHIADNMSRQVDIVEDAFTTGDTERCISAANELSRIWNDTMYYSILINDLGHAVEITSSVAEIVSFAEDSNEEIYASCDRTQAQIALFRDMNTPTLWKIL